MQRDGHAIKRDDPRKPVITYLMYRQSHSGCSGYLVGDIDLKWGMAEVPAGGLYLEDPGGDGTSGLIDQFDDQRIIIDRSCDSHQVDDASRNDIIRFWAADQEGFLGIRFGIDEIISHLDQDKVDGRKGDHPAITVTHAQDQARGFCCAGNLECHFVNRIDLFVDEITVISHFAGDVAPILTDQIDIEHTVIAGGQTHLDADG